MSMYKRRDRMTLEVIRCNEFMYVRVCVCMHGWMDIWMYVCLYVCLYVCMYVCTYVHTCMSSMLYIRLFVASMLILHGHDFYVSDSIWQRTCQAETQSYNGLRTAFCGYYTMHIQSAIYDRYHPADMEFSSSFSCFFLLDADSLECVACTSRAIGKLYYSGSGFGKGG